MSNLTGAQRLEQANKEAEKIKDKINRSTISYEQYTERQATLIERAKEILGRDQDVSHLNTAEDVLPALRAKMSSIVEKNNTLVNDFQTEINKANSMIDEIESSSR